MTFTLLRQTLHGWTDIHGDAPAEFPTVDAALNAAADLDNSWATARTWAVVPTADLASYDLVA